MERADFFKSEKGIWPSALLWLGQVVSLLAIVLGLCPLCEGLPLHRSLQGYLVPIAGGYLAAVLCLALFAIRTGGDSLAGQCARGLIHLASISGLVLIVLSLAFREYCWPCFTFWACHFLFAGLLVAVPPRERLLVGFAALTATAGTAIVALLPASRFELLTVIGQNARSTPSSWIKPGARLHPQLPFVGGSALIIWTECVPCAERAASSALPRFLRKYPEARVWTLSNRFERLPRSIYHRATIPPPGPMFDPLGIKPDDPPVYLILDGLVVKEIGVLAEWRG